MLSESGPSRVQSFQEKVKEFDQIRTRFNPDCPDASLLFEEDFGRIPKGWGFKEVALETIAAAKRGEAILSQDAVFASIIHPSEEVRREICRLKPFNALELAMMVISNVPHVVKDMVRVQFGMTGCSQYDPWPAFNEADDIMGEWARTQSSFRQEQEELSEENSHDIFQDIGSLVVGVALFDEKQKKPSRWERKFGHLQETYVEE